MPRVDSIVSSSYSPSSTPCQPSRKPTIASPYSPTPLRTIARITAFSPGQSPPPVSTPIRTRSIYLRAPHPHHVSLRPRDAVDDRLGDSQESAGEDTAQEQDGADGTGQAEGVSDHHHARAEDCEEDYLHAAEAYLARAARVSLRKSLTEATAASRSGASPTSRTSL